MTQEEAILLLRQSRTAIANAIAALIAEFTCEETAHRVLNLSGNAVELIVDFSQWWRRFADKETATIRLRASRTAINALVAILLAEFTYREMAHRTVQAIGGGQVDIVLDFLRWPERIELKVL